MKDEIHPTAAELQEARRHAKKALERSRNRLQKDEELALCLGWTGEDFVLESMDGAAGRAFGSETIRVRFNTNANHWIPAVKASVAHEFAHA